MKNLNSFKAIARAIEAETARQIDLIESGKKVIQETRRWDDSNGASYPMRSKEDAKDYRYFPDPDLPPVNISDEWLKSIKDAEPELQIPKKERYISEFKLPAYDAGIITSSKKLADIFEETVACGSNPKKVSNWLMGETLRLLKDRSDDPEDIIFSAKHLHSLIKLTEEGAVNNTVAKEVFEKMYEKNIDPVIYVEENGLKTVNDDGALEEIVKKVIESNPKVVDEYRGGKEKVLGFLIGQVMKELKGKANPAKAGEMLKKLL